MEAALQVEHGRIPPGLAASSRFRGFSPECEHRSNKFKVESNMAVESMREAWLKCGFGSREIGKRYGIYLDGVKDLDYSAKDVEIFSVMLSEFQDREFFLTSAGLFLSALVNNCKEDGVTIHTTHLVRPIYYIGWMNTKNMIVDGNAGFLVGTNMLSGSITVNGDADEMVGDRMEGGTIIVRGNADKHVGLSMKGGDITVGGNVRDAAGWEMVGGRIVVGGDAGDRVGCGMRGGAIIVSGHAEDEVGFAMAGGTIVVGSAGHRVGWDMKGGAILVRGDAGVSVGLVMKGGRIHIYGDYGSIADDRSGKIFHKGELIFPK